MRDDLTEGRPKLGLTVDNEQVQQAGLDNTSFAPVGDVRKALTPDIKPAGENSLLLLIDLGGGRNRLGASALTRVYGQMGDAGPDLDDPALFKAALVALQSLLAQELLLAYHDRSDGGLAATLCEMAFAGQSGLDCDLGWLDEDPLAALFAEELGVVVQVTESALPRVEALLHEAGVGQLCHRLGSPAASGRIRISCRAEVLIDEDLVELHRAWSETTAQLQGLRDDPDCAREEFELIRRERAPSLFARLGFDPPRIASIPFCGGVIPKSEVRTPS